jgi:hypothetical protein
MQDNRIWRVVAVLAVLAVFYVGHGLHEEQGGIDDLLAPNVARAQGIAIQPNSSRLFTMSPDGRVVYMWSYINNEIKLVDTAQSKEQ